MGADGTSLVSANAGGTKEIVPLTGLRGLAALTVMVYHFGQPYHTLGVHTGFRVPYGYLAVDLFYILSGFVITYAYGDLLHAPFSISRYWRFILMRIGRLYPAYLAALVLFTLKMAADFGADHPLDAFTLPDVAGNLLMLTGWGVKVRPVVVDSWSVSAELLCYAFFPALLWLVPGRPGRYVPAAGLALIGIWLVARSGEGIKGPLDVVMQTSFYPVLRCVSGFLLGMVSYRLWRIRFLTLVFRHNFSVLSLLGLIGLIAMLGLRDLALYMCLPALVVACSSGSSAAFTLLGGKSLQFLGHISYSLYLIHDVFVTISVRIASYLHLWFGLDRCYAMVSVFGMAGACMLGWMSYRCVEVPGKRIVAGMVSPCRPVEAA